MQHEIGPWDPLPLSLNAGQPLANLLGLSQGSLDPIAQGKP